MKLEFDTKRLTLKRKSESSSKLLLVEESVNKLGQLLMLFLWFNNVEPEFNNYPENGSWKKITSTRRDLLVALMGDGIYDKSPRWVHLHHQESGLNVIWQHDGDLIILFHKEGKDGFTIGNLGGSMTRWGVEDLIDPRNDPTYDPFK